MILGIVSPGGAPEIDLEFETLDLRRHRVRALVDTGFDGMVALPLSWLLELADPDLSSVGMTLADGTSGQVAGGKVGVVWHDGTVIEADAIQMEGGPLLGMSMLHGSTLFIDAVRGGRVEIKPREALETRT
jgi:predicted aspartyl protease